jgi:hypothetical protein
MPYLVTNIAQISDGEESFRLEVSDGNTVNRWENISFPEACNLAISKIDTIRKKYENELQINELKEKQKGE